MDSMFKTRDLYMLMGQDGKSVHMSFHDQRKAVYFFTSQDKAKAYVNAKRLSCGLARVNWKTFDRVRMDLTAAHVRQAVIDPHVDDSDAIVLGIDQVTLENGAIWGATH